MHVYDVTILRLRRLAVMLQGNRAMEQICV